MEEPVAPLSDYATKKKLKDKLDYQKRKTPEFNSGVLQ